MPAKLMRRGMCHRCVMTYQTCGLAKGGGGGESRKDRNYIFDYLIVSSQIAEIPCLILEKSCNRFDSMAVPEL